MLEIQSTKKWLNSLKYLSALRSSHINSSSNTFLHSLENKIESHNSQVEWKSFIISIYRGGGKEKRRWWEHEIEKKKKFHGIQRCCKKWKKLLNNIIINGRMQNIFFLHPHPPPSASSSHFPLKQSSSTGASNSNGISRKRLLEFLIEFHFSSSCKKGCKTRGRMRERGWM